MLFVYCFFKHWNLFAHKIINFKGVPRKNGAGCEITSLSCYLFFEICYLPFGSYLNKMLDFMDRH